ncbi:MAG: LacI family DNA-binding transcriptional regulator [Gaiellaceae bacterium]
MGQHDSATATGLGRGQLGRATIRDIARHAGVSVATVSRVVNGHPNVAPATREAVLQHVRAHGFTTNLGARALAQGRTGLVGLTIPFVHPEYFASITTAIAEALYQQGMRAVVCPTMHERERELTLIERLRNGATDGAILLLPSETRDELEALHDEGLPFVVVDPAVRLGNDTAVVSATHWAGAKEATEHLLELGHRRIGAITGPSGWLATEERLGGYRQALAELGIEPDPELVIVSDFHADGGREATGRLLDLPQPPSAIFAFNDDMALAALRLAQERGLSIPRELSIVGFDDSARARIVTPTLTSVHQPLAEMGRLAVDLLTRIVSGKPVDALQVELPTKLVVRESTAPPRT